MPLILNGWVYSNDVEKAERWSRTIRWTESNGYSSLIPQLADQDKYLVKDLSSYEVGPMGGPMCLPWDFEKKEKPADESVGHALGTLRQKWVEVAGAELAKITEPIGFTGAKRRRLLVHADGCAKPPWGEWHGLSPDDRHRAFTMLRQAVNDAIAPLMVDHIDFDTSERK